MILLLGTLLWSVHLYSHNSIFRSSEDQHSQIEKHMVICVRRNLPQKSSTVLSEPKFGPPLLTKKFLDLPLPLDRAIQRLNNQGMESFSDLCHILEISERVMISLYDITDSQSEFRGSWQYSCIGKRKESCNCEKLAFVSWWNVSIFTVWLLNQVLLTNTNFMTSINLKYFFPVKLGTLGAGNHYAEIQVVDEIYNMHTAKKMGVDRPGQVIKAVEVAYWCPLGSLSYPSAKSSDPRTVVTTPTNWYITLQLTKTILIR